MSDTIEMVGKSLVQHGPGHDRAYLVHLHPADAECIVDNLEFLAGSQGYAKVCARVPAWATRLFVAAGYRLEAAIPRFFPEGSAACFMAKYFDAERSLERLPLVAGEVLTAAQMQQRAAGMPLPAGLTMRVARERDLPRMSALYREVYSGCPRHSHDPRFLRSALSRRTVIFGIWEAELPVALACAEIDAASKSAELSDFATLPQYRGHGVIHHLLGEMEGTLLARGTRNVFTLARAYSFGMNLVLARNGYRFGGTLTNNAVISGTPESMNCWHKDLLEDPRFAWSSVFSQRERREGSA